MGKLGNETKEHRDKGTKDKDTIGQKDKGTKTQRDIGTKGLKDNRTKGQKDKKDKTILQLKFSKNIFEVLYCIIGMCTSLFFSSSSSSSRRHVCLSVCDISKHPLLGVVETSGERVHP